MEKKGFVRKVEILRHTSQGGSRRSRYVMLTHIAQRTRASILDDLVNEVFRLIDLSRLSRLLSHLVRGLPLAWLASHRAGIHRCYDAVPIDDDATEDPCRGYGDARRVTCRIRFLGCNDV